MSASRRSSERTTRRDATTSGRANVLTEEILAGSPLRTYAERIRRLETPGNAGVSGALPVAEAEEKAPAVSPSPAGGDE